MKRENLMKKTVIHKITNLLTSLVLLMAFFVVGCNDKTEPTIGGPSKSVQIPQESQDSDDKNNVDILVPEIAVSESNEFISKDIFDLWDLFFKSFVSVVSEDPFDTRVNYKSLHQLRTSRDKDFLELVSMIEKKMASTDLSAFDNNTKIAFYINTYNYAAIRLVNKGFLDDDGKMITSIRDISRWGYDNEYQIRDTIQLADKIVSLDEIRKLRLRELFSENDRVKDARFYFLLSGATLGRAVQLAQAVRPETLETQLSFATTNALKMSRYVKRRGDSLEVARFFKWYKSDFEDAYDSLENFFSQNGFDRTTFTKVDYQDFLWDLNDQARFTGVVIEEPTQPLPPLAQERKEEEVIPTEPCDYLKSDTVQVLGYCNQVIDGQLNGFYNYKTEAVDAKLCLYSRQLGGGKVSLGVNGTVIEINESNNERESLSIAVEDEAKLKGDQLSMEIAEDVRTRLEYLQTDRRLMVRQTTIILGKGFRKFLLQCE